MTELTLHGFFRSSASYRVRIALSFKGLPYRQVSWALRTNSHQSAQFAAINPQRLVPALQLPDGKAALTQSLAIIEYLEEMQPAPPLLPQGVRNRARVRSLAQAIAADIHPLNNLRVLGYLENVLSVGPQERLAWYAYWIREGFAGLEKQLASDVDTGIFCHGETPTMADVCLVPQVYNARRFNIDLGDFPTIVRIAAACEALPPFRDAQPDRQLDAVRD